MTFEFLQGIGSRNCEEIESASTASGLTTSGVSVEMHSTITFTPHSDRLTLAIGSHAAWSRRAAKIVHMPLRDHSEPTSVNRHVGPAPIGTLSL